MDAGTGVVKSSRFLSFRAERRRSIPRRSLSHHGLATVYHQGLAGDAAGRFRHQKNC